MSCRFHSKSTIGALLLSYGAGYRQRRTGREQSGWCASVTLIQVSAKAIEGKGSGCGTKGEWLVLKGCIRKRVWLLVTLKRDHQTCLEVFWKSKQKLFRL